MTIDEEIKLAQQEKKLNESVNAIMNKLNISDELDEAEILNFKYSPIAEELRNFDYNSALNEYVKNGISTLEEANELNYILEVFDEEILDESNTESKKFGHLYGKTKNREDLEKGHKAAIKDFIKRGTNGEDLKSRSTPDTGNHGIEINGKHYKTTRGRARKTANDVIYKDILKKRAWNKNHPGVPYPTPEEKHEKMSKIGKENVMKRYNKEKLDESYIEYLLEDKREFYNTISNIRFLIEDAKDMINENDISGYNDLARAYVALNKKNR